MHYKRRIATKRALKRYKKARFMQSLISRHLHHMKNTTICSGVFRFVIQNIVCGHKMVTNMLAHNLLHAP